MDNPYWHPDVKPHVIDFAEVKLICFQIFNLVLASVQFGEHDVNDDEQFEWPSMLGLHYQIAEADLSKKLLTLALIVRTYDDLMMGSEGVEEYKTVKKNIEDSVDFGQINDGQLNLREVCNKIVHAQDIRPIYDTTSDRNAKDAIWGMTAEIELQGQFTGGKEWQACFNVLNYVEAIVDLINADPTQTG